MARWTHINPVTRASASAGDLAWIRASVSAFSRRSVRCSSKALEMTWARTRSRASSESSAPSQRSGLALWNSVIAASILRESGLKSRSSRWVEKRWWSLSNRRWNSSSLGPPACISAIARCMAASIWNPLAFLGSFGSVGLGSGAAGAGPPCRGHPPGCLGLRCFFDMGRSVARGGSAQRLRLKVSAVTEAGGKVKAGGSPSSFSLPSWSRTRSGSCQVLRSRQPFPRTA